MRSLAAGETRGQVVAAPLAIVVVAMLLVGVFVVTSSKESGSHAGRSAGSVGRADCEQLFAIEWRQQPSDAALHATFGLGDLSPISANASSESQPKDCSQRSRLSGCSLVRVDMGAGRSCVPLLAPGFDAEGGRTGGRYRRGVDRC